MINYARIGQMLENFNTEFRMLTKGCDDKCEHCAFGILLKDSEWGCIHDVLRDIQDLCE